MSHLEDLMCKLKSSSFGTEHDALVGYDIVGGRKGLYYDATKLLSYVPIASMIEAFGQLESHQYALAKFRDGTVTIEPTGDIYIADMFARSSFPDLVFQRVCTQCDVLQPTNTHYPADSHGPLSRLRYCNDCDKKNKLAKGRERDASKTRICQECKEPRAQTSFGITDKKCFSCRSKKKKEDFKKKNVATPGKTYCPYCKLSKDDDEFGGNTYCATCRKANRDRMKAKRDAAKSST
jgi:hypothetical protein